MRNKANPVIPWLMTLWAVFVIIMYCKIFVVPKIFEFINR